MKEKYRKPEPVSVQMHIRVPPAVKKWLEARATENVKTLNAELVAILEKEKAAEPIAKQFSAASISK
ncbi:hypothetical protein JK165_08930 [Acetobacter okinawensis]|uniref:hypothetical protein n=1 Tax=Acetobacter okinawensis TaxID=1076594 RepID=UPI001BAB200D|nr:hypothetical protein [Acetobacter okinawensis]MBS0966209.1 hypothetical protein [Acetobacter okinawensis]